MKEFLEKIKEEFIKFNTQQKIAAAVLVVAIPLCLGMGVGAVSSNSQGKGQDGNPSPSPTIEATATPSATPTPSPTPEKEKVIKLISASFEEDLEVLITDEKGDLVLNETFVLHVKCSANGYSKKWTIPGDGFLKLTTIPSGVYTVSIEEVEGYKMPREPVTIKVEKKVELKEIDVSDQVVDSSQVNEREEDAAYDDAVSAPVEPVKPKDTVKYADSTKKQTGTNYTYKLKGNRDSDTRIYDKDGKPTDYIATVKDGIITAVYESPYTAPATADVQPAARSTQQLMALSRIPVKTMAKTKNINIIPLVEGDGDPTPTEEPTTTPTATPTPTPTPTAEPTVTPAPTPTSAPTATPTAEPTATTEPTATPTATPTTAPTAEVTATPTVSPSATATATAEPTATTEPTATPTATPTPTPVVTATPAPTATPKPVLIEDFFVDGAVNKKYSSVELKIEVEKEILYKYTGWWEFDDKTYYYNPETNKPVTGEQTIQGMIYFFDSNGVLNTQRIGIDVSKYQKNIDWKAVKKAGVEFAIIRVGYRGYGTGKLVWDEYFKQNIKGATDAGLKVGVYIFSQAINKKEAVEEASMCLEGVSGYKLAYPIFFDTEYSTSRKTGRADWLTKSQRTKIAQAFCETIKNAGYKRGVYASASWFNNQLTYSAVAPYEIWVAHYTNAGKPNFSQHYDIWQYTGSGTCRGVPGAVDMNIGYTYY